MTETVMQFQRAVTLVEAGRLDDAEAICLGILEKAPRDAQTTFLRGLIAYQKSDVTRAIDFVRNATRLDAENPAFHATLGAFLVDHGSAADALAALERATILNPSDAASFRHKARLYQQFGRSQDAVSALQAVVQLGHAAHTDFLALGSLLQMEKGPQAAIPAFEQAVALAPEDVLTQNHLAACLQLCGRVGDAIDAYRRSLRLQARTNPASVGLFAAMQTICDWQDYDSLLAQVEAMTESSIAAVSRPVEDPFLNVTHAIDTQRNYDVARLWSGELSTRVAQWGVSLEPRKHDHGRLRIGYLSSDFHDHATSHLMLGLFAAHDRAKFSIYAYSCSGDDGSHYRQRIAADCDAFVDLSSVDTISAARRIHEDGIDILVDLKGYTRQNRLDIAALRPAPIQVAWLGFPGTSGASFFDYIVTDDTVSPAAEGNRYSESFAVMPHCYQINNRDQEISNDPLSRSDAGLPEAGIVFASFNNTYKLEPVMFGVWMDILRAVPDSVLWLIPNNPIAAENLRREAGANSIEQERLIFADMLPKAQHLKRAGLADLALDTRIYNGHTTTSDMLWAGVPVVTLQGTHFASRVSASLLKAFGLPELITSTREEYQALACNLAQSPARLLTLRKRVADLRETAPLFKTVAFAADLERAYAEMWRRHENGEPPRRLAVSELM